MYQNIYIDETNILVPSKIFHEVTLPLESLEYKNAKIGNFKFYCTFSIRFIILFILKGSRLVFLIQSVLYIDCLAGFDLGSEGRRFEPGLCQVYYEGQ